MDNFNQQMSFFEQFSITYFKYGRYKIIGPDSRNNKSDKAINSYQKLFG